MNARYAMVCVMGVLVGSVAIAQDKETKAKMADLPSAVQQAVKANQGTATLRGLAREVEDGKVRWEAEYDVSGHTKDITFDEQGGIISIEEEVPLDSIPEGARAAIQAAVGGGKLNNVEIVKEGGTTTYEAHYRKGLKRLEVKVDAQGNPVK